MRFVKIAWGSPIFIRLVSGERQVSDRKSKKRRFEIKGDIGETRNFEQKN